LLVQEKKASAYGLWSLPGGRVDKDEGIETAAVREVLEETGFHVTITAELLVEQGGMHTPVFHVFQAKITGGELRIPKGELLDAQWLTLEEIRVLQTDHALRNEWIVRAILKAHYT